MQLIEGNPADVERAQARLAGGDQRARASVGNPLPVRSRQAALGRDANRRRVAAPRFQRAGEQPFVVSDLGVVAAIGVRCVDGHDAGVERRMQDVYRSILVAIRRGRQAHASEHDSRPEGRDIGSVSHGTLAAGLSICTSQAGTGL